MSCNEIENGIEFMIKKSRNKYTKLLENIDIIYDDDYGIRKEETNQK